MHTSAPPWPADVLAPREVGDVDLNRRSLGVHADLAVTAQHDRPDVARRHAIRLNRVHHAGAKLLERERNLHAVDLGRVQQPLHVLRQAEDRRSMRLPVAANPLKYARAVVHHVAHHVDRCLLPGNQVAVVPDLRSGLYGHGGRHAPSFAQFAHFLKGCHALAFAGKRRVLEIVTPLPPKPLAFLTISHCVRWSLPGLIERSATGEFALFGSVSV